MARKGAKKSTNRKTTSKGRSSSESSSESESSEQSSSSESSSEDDERQHRNRGTQKRQTNQVRKNTVRKPTRLQQGQGTLNMIGKSGRSQEEIDLEDDDFNMKQRGGRKATVVRGSESTAEFKRSGQRGMTRVEVKNVITNLEHELQIEKTRKEQMELEKQQNEMLTRNEMNNLHQEKLLLLKKADEKKTHIQSIQKKLVEQKKNNIDIISTKTNSKSRIGCCGPRLLSRFIQFFFDEYLLSSYSYKMSNYFDNKVYEHFAFLSYIFNNSFLAFFVLIYLLINQLVNNSSTFTGLSIFFSYTFNTNVAFLLLCLAFMLTQIIIVFIKFDKYKCKRVREVARFSSRINLFKLLISEYNWKISDKTQLQKIQLALVNRAQFSLNSQNTGNRFSQRNEFDFQLFAFRLTGFALSVGIVIGQLVGIKYILEEVQVDNSNYYVQSLVLGVVCSAICLIGSYLTQLFHSFEQYSGLFLKQLRYFALQIIPCCYILLVKTLILFENKYKIPGYLHISTFLNTQFQCANEQLGYDLIIFMLCYAVMAILFTYLQILFHFLAQKCKRRGGSNATSSIAIKYYYYIRFRSCQQTIPFLVVYFLMLCIIPLNPYIVVVNFFLFGFIFLHNYVQAKSFFLPQLDTFSSTMVKGMIIKLLAFSIILGSIYQVILFSLDYDLGYFKYNGEVFACGPFRHGSSGLNEIWDSLGSFTDFLTVITWKPIILFFLIFFILIAISSANQTNEWQKQYLEKDNELRAIKRFYSKEVNNLEDKIQYAQQNIGNMVEEEIKDVNVQKQQLEKSKRFSDNYLQIPNNEMYTPHNTSIGDRQNGNLGNGSLQYIGNGSMQQFGNSSNQQLGNGSLTQFNNPNLINNYAQNNKDNDMTVQNLNAAAAATRYHSRVPSMTFNIPSKGQAQINSPNVGTPPAALSSKQQLNDTAGKSTHYGASPVLVNNGLKSIFIGNQHQAQKKQ